MNRHIIYSQQFGHVFLEKLFLRTQQIQQQFQNPAGRVVLRQRLADKIMFSIFYEPSTRTRLSFSAAAAHLGMQVISTENAALFSSAIKGESLEDTIKVLNGYYPDVIVLRHNIEGAAERAASVSECPIINAGDGSGQHPTQALLDLYTIWDRLKRLRDLNVVVGGDLAHGRTVRSLVYLLSKFPNISFTFCSPDNLRMLDDIKNHLEELKVPYTETDKLKPHLGDADVIYWTRLQKERMEESLEVEDSFKLNKSHLELMKPFSIILHPLPRNEEIATEVDSDLRAAYFNQSENGMFVRMALLEWIFKKYQ